MSRKKYAICLIDDSHAEIRRFRRAFAERFIIGAGTSIDAALEDLRSRRIKSPDIFLVDLYHATAMPEVGDPEASLNRARAKLLRAELEFENTLNELRQNANAGFDILRELRR
jgi:hypothetical protein